MQDKKRLPALYIVALVFLGLLNLRTLLGFSLMSAVILGLSIWYIAATRKAYQSGRYPMPLKVISWIIVILIASLILLGVAWGLAWNSQSA